MLLFIDKKMFEIRGNKDGLVEKYKLNYLCLLDEFIFKKCDEGNELALSIQINVPEKRLSDEKRN